MIVCFNPLSSGAMTAGKAVWILHIEAVRLGFNPLSSGAMTAGDILSRTSRRNDMKFQSPFKRGNDCGSPRMKSI